MKFQTIDGGKGLPNTPSAEEIQAYHKAAQEGKLDPVKHLPENTRIAWMCFMVAKRPRRL